MTNEERQHADELILVLKTRLSEDDDTILGLNVGMNCGEAAGQTVMHAHIHLIPRRKGTLKTRVAGLEEWWRGSDSIEFDLTFSQKVAMRA